MDPKLKKYLEIFLVIFILWLIVHIILYIYYFDDFCNKYSWVNEVDTNLSIYKLAKCKDSFVCKPEEIVSDRLNNITDWSCNKDKVYLEFYNNLKERYSN